MNKILIMAASISLVLFGTPALQAAPPPATREAAELRSSLMARYARVRSLQVWYRAYEAEKAGTSQFIDVSLAAKEGKRWQRMWHGTAGAYETDPDASLRFCREDAWNVFRPWLHRYETSKKFATPPYTDKIRANPFFANLGWWPPNDASACPRLLGRSYFTTDVLKQEGWRVSTAQSLVEGRWCHVLELPNSNRLFVDSVDVVVRRHEIYRNGFEEPAIAVLELNDYRLIDEDIWLPYQLSRVFHDTGVAVRTVVDRYEVNQVPDSLFQFTPPPGTLVYDRDTDTFNQIPGGLEVLERFAASFVEQNEKEMENGHFMWPVGFATFCLGASFYWIAMPATVRFRSLCHRPCT